MRSEYCQNILRMCDLVGVCLIYLTQEIVKSFFTHDLFGVIQEDGSVDIFFAARIGTVRKYIPWLVQIAMIQPLQDIRLSFAAYIIASICIDFQ